jgi:hypothetical protein
MEYKQSSKKLMYFKIGVYESFGVNYGSPHRVARHTGIDVTR